MVRRQDITDPLLMHPVKRPQDSPRIAHMAHIQLPTFDVNHGVQGATSPNGSIRQNGKRGIGETLEDWIGWYGDVPVQEV